MGSTASGAGRPGAAPAGDGPVNQEVLPPPRSLPTPLSPLSSLNLPAGHARRRIRPITMITSELCGTSAGDDEPSSEPRRVEKGERLLDAAFAPVGVVAGGGPAHVRRQDHVVEA